jgi:hypothetical protein
MPPGPRNSSRLPKGPPQDWADDGDITADCVVNALGVPVAAIRRALAILLDGGGYVRRYS